jgi:hypothetical protein
VGKEKSYLTIPKGVQLSDVALKITAPMSYEQWEKLGRGLQRIHRSALFWLGDWLRYGETKWGKKFSQAIEGTGYAVQTLANAQWVASRIESSRRREELSWSHHLEIAALEASEQDKLLQAASDNDWGVRELREAVQKFKKQIEAPSDFDAQEQGIKLAGRLTKELDRWPPEHLGLAAFHIKTVLDNFGLAEQERSERK